jgi:hypothetical protein
MTSELELGSPDDRALVSSAVTTLAAFGDRDQPESTALILSLTQARAYYVGQEIVDIDRELRRTAAERRAGSLDLEATLLWSTFRLPADFIGGQGEPERPTRRRTQGTRPDHPTQSSLQLVAAEAGSTHLLLEPLGALVTVLVSDPLTAITNAMALSGGVHTLRAFLGRKLNALQGFSGRQLLRFVAQEMRGDSTALLGAPDHEIQLVPEAGPYLRLPDGTEARGTRRVRYIRRNTDGSTDWFELE